MRRYESYKDSGVEWLGEVPSHWESFPLFVQAKISSITNHIDKELLSVYLDRGVVRFSDVDEKRTNVTSLDLSKYQLVRKGNLVLNNQQAWRGSVGVSSYEGIVSPAYLILELSNKFDPHYANYLFRNSSMVSHYLIASKGVGTIQRNLYWGNLSRTPIFIPPLSEQQKISQFLDDKTSKIDQAVELAEKQIALLKEHKQILIQNAVTRGLNSDVLLKDSGVEWQGDLPSHWDVQRSKFIFKKIERKVNEEDQIVTCFRDGQVTLRANRRTEGFTNALKEHGYQGIRKGDLVIHAMDAFAGAIGISDSDGKATPVYSVCLPHDKQKIDVYFYAYYLRNLALSGFISSLAKGIRERSTDFRYADFAELLLPIPPYLEQQKIADYLDKQTAKIDQAIALKTAHIEKLKEYKSVLINDVVTGKVRV